MSFNKHVSPDRCFFLFPCHKAASSKHRGNITLFISSLYLSLKLDKTTFLIAASLVAQTVKNPPTMQETWFNPWVGTIPWRKEQKPTLVLLPGESPSTEKPGRLQSMGSQRVRRD